MSISAGYTLSNSTGALTLQAGATMAMCQLALQAIWCPAFTIKEGGVARFVVGHPTKRFLTGTLAVSSFAGVLYVLF